MFLVRQPSWRSVAAGVLPKVVILLHVVHVSRGELSEVLGAAVVHAVGRREVEVLTFVVGLALHLGETFWEKTKEEVQRVQRAADCIMKPTV